MAKNPIELMIYDQKGSSPKVMPAVQAHNREMLTREAEFAKNMIHAGMLAGFHRKRGNVEAMDFMPPQQVVQRACKLAELAFAEFAKRGWIIPMPSYDEMRDKIERDTESIGTVGFVNGEARAGR